MKLLSESHQFVSATSEFRIEADRHVVDAEAQKKREEAVRGGNM